MPIGRVTRTSPAATQQPATPSLLRAINDRAALALFLEHGQLTRTQVSSLTGLSKPTAGQLLVRLVEAGLVRSVGTSSGGPGPAAQVYELDPTAAYAAALDVRPGRLVAVVSDLRGTVVGEAEVRATRKQPADAVEDVTAGLAGASAAAGMDPAGLASVVISTPGSFDPETGDLRYARHLTGWQEPGLLGRLRREVGVQLDVENDVNLIALAEQRDGAAVDASDFCLMWHDDDGFGAAIVVDGRLHRGATGGAGELGYLPVPGAPVVRHVIRANSGGFVKLAGLPAILELGEEFGVPGRSAVTVVRRAASSAAEGAGELLDELAERYALGLAAVVAVLDPQAVVLSGSVLQAGGEPLRSRVERQLGELAMTVPAVRLGALRTPILAGALHAALDTARDAAFAAAR